MKYGARFRINPSILTKTSTQKQKRHTSSKRKRERKCNKSTQRYLTGSQKLNVTIASIQTNPLIICFPYIQMSAAFELFCFQSMDHLLTFYFLSHCVMRWVSLFFIFFCQQCNCGCRGNDFRCPRDCRPQFYTRSFLFLLLCLQLDRKKGKRESCRARSNIFLFLVSLMVYSSPVCLGTLHNDGVYIYWFRMAQ